MQYALLIYSATGASPDQQQHPDEVFDDWAEYTRALKSTGALLALKRLEPAGSATSVMVRGGERLVTDGPFIETKEHLLGFYLVDLPDPETAVEWAGRMPHVRHGAAEVRQVTPTEALDRIAVA